MSHSVYQGIWRFLELLPVDPSSPRLGALADVGGTPLVACPELAARLEIRALAIKDEGRNPTGALKDRATAIAVVRAHAEGKTVLACASTGNAACSLAGLTARVGFDAVVFVPRGTPPAKIASMRAFGARVLLVDGSYDQAFELSTRVAAELGWYDRNAAANPYLVDGKKTCGHELAHAMADDPPDVVVVAVGDGCTLTGIAKGLREMQARGVLPRIPRLLGVQADGARALVDAWETGAPCREAPARTVVDSIRVGLPRNAARALAAVRESGGRLVAVADEQSAAGAAELARHGVLGDLASGAALAGLRAARARGWIQRDDSVALVATGNGLKDLLTEVRSEHLGATPRVVSPRARAKECT